MKKGTLAKKWHVGKLLAVAAVCLLMFSGLSDTLAINTYVRDLKGLAVPVQTYNVGAPVVALTFDVRNAGDRVGDILRELRQADVKATFFLTGEWVAAHPETARAIVADGHVVGQSLYLDQNADNLTPAQVAAEMKKTDVAWHAAGLPDQKLFRAPDGLHNTAVEKVIRDRQEQMIAYTVNAEPTAVSLQGDAFPGLTESLQGGEILRMEAKGSDVEALPQLIEKVQQAGFRFGTIAALQSEVHS